MGNDTTLGLARHAIKPLANATVFRRARRRLQAAVLEALAGCRTIIDVAAGDDGLYSALAARPEVEWVLLNDLDREALRRGMEARPKVARLCADALQLDFLRRRFDAALVKNVLHHMADREATMRLLRTARGLARRVVVVEIEDPRASALPRLLHRHYYRGALGEQDNEELFVDHAALRSVVVQAYPGTGPQFRRIRTVRGTYSLCRVDFESAGGK